MCANGRLYVLSGNLSLLCAIKFVFASLLRLDVTGMRADGSNPVGFFIAKNGILGRFWLF